MDFSNKIILAPMAGITDMPFRKLCVKHGADIVVSEMVSAKALFYGDKRSAALLATCEEEQPCIMQIFGSEPEIMAYGANKTAEISNCPAIDINMGCPVPKIVNNSEGSALMKNPTLIFDIVKAVTGSVDIPVTVKMRSGFDTVCALECALAAEEGGASAVTVHGKTRTQYYKPPVNLEIIAAVKATLKIPVIGNGDIVDIKSAKQMLEYTKCDSIMIGRAAMGNPFIFDEIKAVLNSLPYQIPTVIERLETARAHLTELVEFKGEHIGSLESRGQLIWYLKGIKGAAGYRAKACKVSNLNDINSLIDEIKGNSYE